MVIIFIMLHTFYDLRRSKIPKIWYFFYRLVKKKGSTIYVIKLTIKRKIMKLVAVAFSLHLESKSYSSRIDKLCH